MSGNIYAKINTQRLMVQKQATINGPTCFTSDVRFKNDVIFEKTIMQTGGVDTDTINESTPGNGVLVDGFHIKDGTAYVDNDPGKEVENKGNKDQPNGYAGLDMSGKIPISSLASQPLIFRGCWDAATNTPTLVSGVGTNGDYWLVSVAGTTNLDGYNSWSVGDAALFKAGTPGFWSRLDHVSEVVSVNGQTGVVSLGLDDLDDVAAGSPNNGEGLYWNGSNWVNTPVLRTLDGVSPVLPSGNIDLIAGTDITLTPGVGSITINSSGGSSVTLTNAGGDETLVKNGTGPLLATKGLSAGTGISLSSNANWVTVTNSSPASGVTLTSAGGTETLVNDGTGPSLATKGLSAGTGITLTGTATDITVTNSSPASSVTLASAGGTETLVNDGTGPSLATKGLSAGTGITLTSNATSITIAASASSGSIPTGTLLDFAGTVAPSGYLLCDGAAVSTITYAALFAVISYSYGGAGASFNVPDFRGRFVRYADNMGTGAAGRDVGARDAAQAQTQSTATNGITVSSVGDHQHTTMSSGSVMQFPSGPAPGYGTTQPYNGQGCQALVGSGTGFAGSHTHSLVDPMGAETRPINVRCYKIIKT
jgi:microcystin-dependent protein